MVTLLITSLVQGLSLPLGPLRPRGKEGRRFPRDYWRIQIVRVRATRNIEWTTYYMVPGTYGEFIKP